MIFVIFFTLAAYAAAYENCDDVRIQKASESRDDAYYRQACDEYAKAVRLILSGSPRSTVAHFQDIKELNDFFYKLRVMDPQVEDFTYAEYNRMREAYFLQLHAYTENQDEHGYKEIIAHYNAFIKNANHFVTVFKDAATVMFNACRKECGEQASQCIALDTRYFFMSISNNKKAAARCLQTKKMLDACSARLISLQQARTLTDVATALANKSIDAAMLELHAEEKTTAAAQMIQRQWRRGVAVVQAKKKEEEAALHQKRIAEEKTAKVIAEANAARLAAERETEQEKRRVEEQAVVARQQAEKQEAEKQEADSLRTELGHFDSIRSNLLEGIKRQSEYSHLKTAHLEKLKSIKKAFIKAIQKHFDEQSDVNDLATLVQRLVDRETDAEGLLRAINASLGEGSKIPITEITLASGIRHFSVMNSFGSLFAKYSKNNTFDTEFRSSLAGFLREYLLHPADIDLEKVQKHALEEVLGKTLAANISVNFEKIHFENFTNINSTTQDGLKSALLQVTKTKDFRAQMAHAYLECQKGKLSDDLANCTVDGSYFYFHCTQDPADFFVIPRKVGIHELYVGEQGTFKDHYLSYGAVNNQDSPELLRIIRKESPSSACAQYSGGIKEGQIMKVGSDLVERNIEQEIYRDPLWQIGDMPGSESGVSWKFLCKDGVFGPSFISTLSRVKYAGTVLSRHAKKIKKQPTDELIKDIPGCFVRLFSQVSQLHRKGFLHRDIKLQNVLFNEAVTSSMVDECNLIDFGASVRFVDGRIESPGFNATPDYVPFVADTLMINALRAYQEAWIRKERPKMGEFLGKYVSEHPEEQRVKVGHSLEKNDFNNNVERIFSRSLDYFQLSQLLLRLVDTPKDSKKINVSESLEGFVEKLKNSSGVPAATIEGFFTSLSLRVQPKDIQLMKYAQTVFVATGPRGKEAQQVMDYAFYFGATGPRLTGTRAEPTPAIQLIGNALVDERIKVACQDKYAGCENLKVTDKGDDKYFIYGKIASIRYAAISRIRRDQPVQNLGDYDAYIKKLESEDPQNKWLPDLKYCRKHVMQAIEANSIARSFILDVMFFHPDPAVRGACLRGSANQAVLNILNQNSFVELPSVALPSVAGKKATTGPKGK